MERLGRLHRAPPQSSRGRARRARARPRATRVGGETELLDEHLQRRRRAERVHADDRSAVADVAVPAERRRLLDRDPRLHRRRQHLVAVGLRLAVEELPARHADDARADAARRRARRAPRARAPTSDPVAIRITSGSPLGVDRARTRPSRRSDAGAIADRSTVGSAWRERTSDRRLSLELRRRSRQVSATSFASAGPEHEQARDRPQRHELLDRLMGRPVLADPDRVVREDVDDGDLHQRGQPDRATRVVGEDEEARPERPELGERHPVRDRRRGVLADAEVEVAPAPLVGLEVAGAVERQARLRRGREVGGTAEQPGHVLRDARSAPGRTSRGSRCPSRRPGRRRDVRVPAVGQLAALHPLDLVGELGMVGAVLGERRLPRLAGLACRARRCRRRSARRRPPGRGTPRPRASR